MIENVFTKSDTGGNELHPLLCPVDLFRYFIRINYKGIEITNEEIEGIRIEFAKYLHELNLTDKQKENILPKSIIDVLINDNHPFRMHGFPPAYVFHFAEFIEKEKEKALAEGYDPNGA